jgi:hypothetical protein
MIVRVRLTQVDGALPNLALMKLAHFHRSQGDDVRFTRSVDRDRFEPDYDRVYASVIFDFSAHRLARLRSTWPHALVGGTGAGLHCLRLTVEELIGSEYEHYDYGAYPDFRESIGFTQRGCRLNCGFCCVRTKEGRPRSVNTIANIWRGEPWPRKLRLLDNDFFGQPRGQWRARILEIRGGGFRVNITQGINVRLIDDEAAEALASIEYRDTKFRRRKLYTAWDNLKDEDVFFRGVERLQRAGIPPTHLRVYMLVGYDKSETWERIFYRFERMTAMGIQPFVMVKDRTRLDLRAFQRWANLGLYRIVPWSDYRAPGKTYSPNSALHS